jgi:hypothetical protein
MPPEDRKPKKPSVRLSAAVERLRQAALECEGAGGSFKVRCLVLCHLNLLTLPEDFDALPAARPTQLLIRLEQEKAPSVQTHYCKLLRTALLDVFVVTTRSLMLDPALVPALHLLLPRLNQLPLVVDVRLTQELQLLA